MLVFWWQCKVYDLSTALFMSFLLDWLARGNLVHYHAMFPLACLNRETAFFLIIIFAVYGLRRLTIASWIQGVGYQAFVFLGIRILPMLYFASSPGEQFLFRPVENLQMYIDAPVQGALYLLGTLFVLWTCLRKWYRLPALLRTAFLIMAPSLAILYLLVGYTFEIRVFAEIYPVIVTMGTWRL